MLGGRHSDLNDLENSEIQKMQIKNLNDGIDDYLKDAGNLPGGYAERVYMPESIDEIREIVRSANAEAMPLTICGGRTGTVGGAVPFGGAVISVEKLNRIKAIDPATMTATLEPGVVLGDLQRVVEEKGLYYPPDPTEWSCQIGGTVATNASGARSFKYGPTRNYVQALTVVLPDGDLVRLRRGKNFAANGMLCIQTESGRRIEVKLPTYTCPKVRKNVSGYFASSDMDAIDLFIGSEGTLGVIAEVELRLVPRPAGTFSGIVFFPAESDLLSFVGEVRRLSFAARGNGNNGCIDATLIEYFDDKSLRFIREKFPETPVEMAGAIYFEQETTPETEDEVFAAYNHLLEQCNAAIEKSWFAVSSVDREKMRSFRHSLPVAVNERVVRNKQKKIGTDMAVPDENFASFLRFYKEILSASGSDYVIFGHIGDCHLHANLLPADDNQARRAIHIYGRCVAQAIMLGGCVSAEHGIGKLKRKYLYVMMGERYINEMAEVKRAFDPKGILGSGNMFSEIAISD
ncbi:MAG: FAD-binding oxidoreductase [Blastocatellia bacterium]